MKKIKLTKDRALGLIVLAVSLFFGYYATLTRPSRVQGDPGPVVFPLGLCLIMGLCAIYLIVKPDTDAEKGKKPFLTKEEKKRLITLYSVFVLYVLLLEFVGYIVTLPIILFIVCYLFGRPKNISVKKSIVYAVVVFAVLYLLYVVVIGSVLPTGKLFEALLH